MKMRLHKDCIRVKMSNSEYNALVHLIALAQQHHQKKSIDDACKCAEMAYWLFIEGSF